MNVTYKPVVDYTAYRVGSDGTVWTCLKATYPTGRGRVGAEYIPSDEWRLLKTFTRRSGHLTVALSTENKKRTFFVHHLVLFAFVGPKPLGMECRHFPDRNPANNNLVNLSWATKKVNQRDRFTHGTHCAGSRNAKASFTDEQVLDILVRLDLGESQSSIARSLNVRQTTIQRIDAGKSYRSVGREQVSAAVAKAKEKK